MRFDLADIKAFVTVAKLGSFTAAAAEMHLSQSALSRRIDKLEAALNAPLLKRTTRKVSLTPVGMEFNRRATELLHNFDEALFGIGDFTRSISGEVTISCMPSAIRFFLPPILRIYHTRYPGIILRLVDHGATEAISAVRRGEVDFAFNHIETPDPALTFERVLEERIVLACQPTHALARKSRVKWAELAAFDYMTASRTSSNRLLIDLALAAMPVKLSPFCETPHVSTLVGLVEAGMGIAAVPSICMPIGAHPNLVSVPLVAPIISRKIGLISRTGAKLAPAAQKLYDEILAVRQARHQMFEPPL
ncbi:LysR family transcriptional regulator [Pseudochelatococcus sp. B33]